MEFPLRNTLSYFLLWFPWSKMKEPMKPYFEKKLKTVGGEIYREKSMEIFMILENYDNFNVTNMPKPQYK